jgi:tRNA(adenine34) deaminase
LDDAELMELALDAARAAEKLGEVPVGAVVAVAGKAIAVAHNEREMSRDPTAHAEILALRRAAAALGRWRLFDATLYVTLEPCPMCAGALVHARVPRLIYGTSDPRAGAVRTLYRIADDPRLNHRVEIVEGLRAEESAELLRAFFRDRRTPKS